MNSGTKFWLGFFTFLPIVLVILFFGFFFTIFLENIVALENSHHNEFPIEMFQLLVWVVMFIIITALVSLSIRIYYIIHANAKKENDTNKKIVWILLLILMGTMASIIYYFVEIIPLKPLKKAKR